MNRRIEYIFIYTKYYLKFLLKILFGIFCFFYLYINIYINLVIQKITVDSRIRKTELYLFSYNFLPSWKLLWIIYPIIKKLKLYANKREKPLILILVNEKIATYLFNNKLIDGYLLTSEFFQRDLKLFSIFKITWKIKYKNINEEIKFKNGIEFLNFFWNNYIFSNVKFIGIPFLNPYLYWIIKISNRNNVVIYENRNRLKSLFFQFIFLINKKFLFLSVEKVIIYRGNEYDFLNLFGNQLNNKLIYNPISYKPISENHSVKVLSKKIKEFIKKNKNFYFIPFTNTNKYAMWPSSNLAELISIIYNKNNYLPIILFKNNNILDKYPLYINELFKSLPKNLRDKLLFLQHGVDYSEVELLMKLAKFSICYDDYFYTFLILTGNSGILISGNINANILFPINSIFLLKNQKVIFHYDTKGENNISYLNKKINELSLKMTYAKDIYEKISFFM